MSTIGKNMLRSAVLLGGFAILGTALVAFTNLVTEQRIEQNIREYTLRKLHELIPPATHDNDIAADAIQVRDDLLSNKQPVTVYRAKQQGQTFAVIMQAIAPDGYSGRISLLVAANRTGELIGVRVTEHKETPGLGDAIEKGKSSWIDIFNGKSLNEPGAENWRVARDGGHFDQITSATITSRAVVRAVHDALRYFSNHKKDLLSDT